ncbi:Transcription elongation factor, GreA/GreB, C-term [Lishizhenia tianjinensis]|uniref:Transcription elongation factor, GreA/GreB, C-term n=1 Tax=Lishizhenia tianjinensis TaxID=477690 RepID=A0A1I6YDN2_9FLAO|nr:GreA/GreB family elongation factor [Lishizhenia tianjinensis]SFT48304.1 Transcription elongation factor, GreA/GreB, C-term [Lishizhenia tianjinensis]
MVKTEVKVKEVERDKILKLFENKTLNSFHLTLKEKLENSKICKDDELPAKTISLGKLVSFKTSFGLKTKIKLVLPQDTDPNLNKFSILSTLGCTIFGYSEGDKVIWKSEGIYEEIEITEVK